MTDPSVLVVVLAGGEGRRLHPLTRDRAKPAVPFAGSYRLVDFVLSNFANAGYHKTIVLTQYKSHSLERHVTATWGFPSPLGNYVKPVSAQMRRGPHWFEGSADAVLQNLNLIESENPDLVCVFGADHIYRMDPSQMIADHQLAGGGATVAALRVPASGASAFGIIEAEPGRGVAAFHEKPLDPPTIPGDPGWCLASMGNYVFDTKLLVEALENDADDEESKHDFGGDILPRLTEQGLTRYYDFSENRIAAEPDGERGYWRDVGTIDAYHAANMDLLAPMPRFNLYLKSWPIHTFHPALPPAKMVSGASGRHGAAVESLVCQGSIISGGCVQRSIVGPGVYVEDGARVEECILLDDVRVGEGAVLRRCVVDKGAVIPAGARIGFDAEDDGARFTRSDGGVVVIPRNARL
jgi:glucose-1-phosphate adenylyltransferase